MTPHSRRYQLTTFAVPLLWPLLGLKEMLNAVGSQEVLGHFPASLTGLEEQQRQQQCEQQ